LKINSDWSLKEKEESKIENKFRFKFKGRREN